MQKFKPQARPSKAKKGHVLLDLNPEVYEEVVAAASANGVSIKSFCRQAVRFSLDNLDKS